MHQRLDPETIIANAQELIDRAKAALAEGEHFFQKHGLNREKSLAVLQAHIGGKEREELEQIMRDDKLAIEQEVHEEMARLGLLAAPPKAASAAAPTRMRRSMI